jgi:hypothetical protein
MQVTVSGYTGKDTETNFISPEKNKLAKSIGLIPTYPIIHYLFSVVNELQKIQAIKW